MKLTISRYTDEDAALWDDFVWQANNGNIFHTRQFLNYHPPGRFEDHSLIFRKDNKVHALMPATVKFEGHRKILVSHRGASYGGIVTKYHPDLEEFLLFFLPHHIFPGSDTPPVRQQIQ